MGGSAQRVAVFIGYRDVYEGARRAFFSRSTDPADGQVQPLRLGFMLKGIGDANRRLSAVRVYRGMPSSQHDPEGFTTAGRQIAAWKKQGLVTVTTRPLDYRDPTHPGVKGIDVRIALDVVVMALRNEYDVGILFSRDTDLLPALEVAVDLGRSIEVAAWKPLAAPPHRLRFDPARRLGQQRCHLLTLADLERVRDPTDYSRPWP
jgi:hypothetical protein